MPEEQQRWYAIKLFERDEKVLAQLDLSDEIKNHIEHDIAEVETELDDDSESIITNERYIYISSIIHDCYKKKHKDKMTTSDKIDRVVTNRWAALPIFAVIMFAVYYIAISTVGAWGTDWVNDNLFGDGFHLFGIGSSQYEELDEEFAGADEIVNGYISYAEEKGYDTEAVSTALDTESEDFDSAKAKSALTAFATDIENYKGIDFSKATYSVEDEETLATEDVTATLAEFKDAVATVEKYNCEAPDPAEYGVWVPGIPELVSNGLDSIGCADWLSGLINDGIVAGVGAVLGFVPQMLVLFILLAFLEACGYMARIAFVMDRIFRKFGLSGKSFIPMLIGTGCGVPGIMASRTIENERDRRMTIMTTTFIPCSAKTPFIAMIAGALFGGSAWIATFAYFLGVAAIIVSGIILKKTKMFSGDPAPFVMELPAYHWPTVGSVLRSMWERGWSFIKKAGTIILLSTIVLWFLMSFGWANGSFGMLEAEQLDASILAKIGTAIAWIFAPLGWTQAGQGWKMAVAAVSGLIAKENVVATFGMLYGFAEVAEDGSEVWGNLAQVMTPIAAYGYLVFNLLCAPCFAAMGAIKREMNNPKWFWFAIGYQCILAYIVAMCIYQIGTLFTAGVFGFGTVVAFIFVIGFIYLLFRKDKYAAINK